jgi:hypothetical protein
MFEDWEQQWANPQNRKLRNNKNMQSDYHPPFGKRRIKPCAILYLQICVLRMLQSEIRATMELYLCLSQF